MRVTFQGKEYKLNGDDVWDEQRFNSLKKMNEKGKVCIVEIDGQREKYLVPIGDLEIKDEPRNYQDWRWSKHLELYTCCTALSLI